MITSHGTEISGIQACITIVAHHVILFRAKRSTITTFSNLANIGL